MKRRRKRERVVFFGCLLVATGCARYPTWKDVPVSCDVEKPYELLVTDGFEITMANQAAPGWTAGDGSPGWVMTGELKPIPEGPLCPAIVTDGGVPTPSQSALVITAEKNNDWGSLFGLNGFAHDATDWEGLSFWARAPGNSNTGFTLLLDDWNTSNPDPSMTCGADAGLPPPVPDGGLDKCNVYCSGDGGTGTGTTEPGTGMIIPGSVTAAPEPDQCGNGYQTMLAVASDWRFYTIPFSEFFQTSTPNRVPNKALPHAGPFKGTGIRPANLLNLIFRMPKAVRTELWIDNLGFYRRKAM